MPRPKNVHKHTRVCRVCNEEKKLLTHFATNNPNKFTITCKSCQKNLIKARAYERQITKLQSAISVLQSGRQDCAKCGKSLPLTGSSYKNEPKALTGVRKVCQTCYGKSTNETTTREQNYDEY